MTSICGVQVPTFRVAEPFNMAEAAKPEYDMVVSSGEGTVDFWFDRSDHEV